MIQFVVQMTNSYGRRSVSGWSDVDDKEIRNYIGLLILAGVYRSKGESTRSLWDDQNKKITCDNFFTSFSLAQELLRKKVALVGTIRANKPELPLKLKKTKKRAVFSSLFAFTTTTTAVSYILLRGRNVLLLSTKHREPAVIQGDKQKPQIIVTYNCCKGGVDNLDKVVSTYSCRRRTRRWPLVLFFNCIDVSAFNAFVLYTAVDPFWNQQRTYKQRLFLEELGKSMVSSEIVRRTHPPMYSSCCCHCGGVTEPSCGEVCATCAEA
ncbi:piggyBac transposable element-derived protein 1-like [Acanthopagrus latus]|uniref:piggyBac transposable element-derived protein 1-like n=1 Tax=Acanthopagrus latus TaxID=8177 RepID=UPI00187C1543|nr:piggyBac transposable element-derived protein 1-like [Acanthopagrus latus]